MNSRAIWAIVRKDIKAITANLQVWLPMLILPLILGLILPVVVVLTSRFGTESMSPSDLQMMLGWVEELPAGALRDQFATLATTTERLIFVAANFVLAPFFLIIPLMTASVISADSFAGEKERGTLETLLFAPVDMRSLFVGKVLASFLPAMGLSLLTFLLCAVSINLAGWPVFQKLFFPTLNWLPLLLLVIPAVSLLAILVNVFVSARVSSFQAAYQLGGVVVLPVLLLVAGQATGVLVFDSLVVVLVGLAMAVVDGLLLLQVLRRMSRNLLFASQIK